MERGMTFADKKTTKAASQKAPTPLPPPLLPSQTSERAVFVIDWSHRQGNELRACTKKVILYGVSVEKDPDRTKFSPEKKKKRRKGPGTGPRGWNSPRFPFVIGKRSRMKSGRE